MRTRVLAIAAVAAVYGCKDVNPPADLAAPADPSKMISDGAHGGNKDFFFLPPMVPLPIGNPDFELGKFNNTLKPSLKIEICELNADHLTTGGLPTDHTTCGAIKKTFAPGSVNLVNLPVRQNGWWSLFNLPPDGFYYVLWDTRQSNLNVKKYYRISVLIDGNSTPLGIADVDPMSNLSQWKYSNTGQVIQLVDDVMLPIPFRVEKGGGSVLCGGASVCGSATITNNSSTGSQTITVDGGAGAVAGVQFPNGWLPANGPQSVVVTVAQVDLGTTDRATGAETTPCHAGLPLQQFPGCFRFTTTPALQPIDESGRQFAQPVIGAVCYTLYGTGDPREKFAEMYASGPNEPPHALNDASDVGILSPATRNCSTSTEVIGATGGNAAIRFASASWRRMKSSLDQIFGVKTAYAVDLGLGGYMTEFSNVGPALAATIEPITATDTTLVSGTVYTPFVRIVGANHHDGQHQNSIGLAGLPVTWTVAANGGSLSPQGETGGTGSQLIAITNSLPITDGATSGGGYSTVNWALPNTPGRYTITANGPALGGPVTFSVTVTSSIAQLRAQAFDNFSIAYRGNGTGGGGVGEGLINFSGLLSDELSFAETFPTRIVIDQRAMTADNVSIMGVFRDLQRARATLDFAAAQSGQLGDAAPNPSDLIVMSGFADVLAAETWCSGVPVSQINSSGVMVYGPQQTTDQLLSIAIAKFDTVLSLAAGNQNLVGVSNIARIGKARAQLDLYDLAGAAATASAVPTAFTFTLGANAAIPTQNNGVFEMQNVQRRWAVSENEGGNGLPYRSDADPRIPFTANGFGFDGLTPMYMQQKYTSLGASTPLALGLEARLIEAEVHMLANDLPAMTASLNTVRTQLGLVPLVTPTDLAQARATLFKERAYTLWLTAHRLGDLRRQVRYYDDTQDQIFPTGEYPKGGVYGTDVNFPIPADPQFNPTGMACLDRGP